jgi:hypothetical protein
VLSVTNATRVLVATTPVDLRGSFNRLYGLVVELLKGDPLSGHLFVFTNGRRNRIKVLYWDGDALWVCAKRSGERSAVIYTLLGSCRRHGINPFDYLKDLFTRLPAAKITQIKDFTPPAWARANNNASQDGFKAA